MPSYPEIIVIRHGETEWNEAMRCQGQLDSILTKKGEAQAHEMGEVLRQNVNLDDYQVIVSSAGRAQQTAKLMGLAGKSEPRLQELFLGDWQGLYRHEFHKVTPEFETWQEREPFFWYFRAPNGETLDAFRGRLQAVLDEIDRPTIIVAHGIVLRIMRAQILGLDNDAMMELPAIQGEIYQIKNGAHATLVRRA